MNGYVGLADARAGTTAAVSRKDLRQDAGSIFMY